MLTFTGPVLLVFCVFQVRPKILRPAGVAGAPVVLSVRLPKLLPTKRKLWSAAGDARLRITLPAPDWPEPSPTPVMLLLAWVMESPELLSVPRPKTWLL